MVYEGIGSTYFNDRDFLTNWLFNQLLKSSRRQDYRSFINIKLIFWFWISLLRFLNKMSQTLLFGICLNNVVYETRFLKKASQMSRLFCVCLNIDGDILQQRQSLLWSHGSWIYNYLCNQCLTPPNVLVRIPLMAKCTRYNIMW